MRMPFEERFWSLIDKSGPNGCWIWNGSLNNKGYGQIYGKEVGQTLAHRISYQYAKGRIPRGRFVLHNCDTPRCVNPDHLRVGTQQENIQDKIVRKRQPRGEVVVTAKLTAEKVFTIREKYLAGVPRAQIAIEADISEVTIKRVVSGRSWQHLIGQRGQTIERLNTEKAKREKAGSVLTAEHIPYVRSEIEAGRSNQDLAYELGVHRRTIADIRNGLTWRDV